MYLIREVFHTKPGKAKELVKKFKAGAPYFEKQGMKNFRIMTDIAATYWTVVLESEVEDLANFAKEIRSGTSGTRCGENYGRLNRFSRRRT